MGSSTSKWLAPSRLRARFDATRPALSSRASRRYGGDDGNGLFMRDGITHGVGLAGHNSDVSYDDPTLNITRCCLTCDAHAGCLGWTLNKVQKRCWIKTIIDNHPVDGAVSGLRPGVPTNPPKRAGVGSASESHLELVTTH